MNPPSEERARILGPKTVFGLPIGILAGLLLTVAGGVWVASANYSSAQATTEYQGQRINKIEDAIIEIQRVTATKEDLRALREDIRALREDIRSLRENMRTAVTARISNERNR